MMPNITSIRDDFAISAQLLPADFENLARLGFRSVINNLPDGEFDNQPTAVALREAAEAQRLFYAHLPVPDDGFDRRAILRMRALVGELPAPVLAFCRDGERSRRLYRAAFADDSAG